TPRITTVHFFYKTSGMEAASMLIEQMEDDRAVTKELKMGFEIMENGSTISG
ncbi:LacI family transcriptional regulator, partial [Bacteroides vulgatus]|nr:LacI family transcriptional regulator [Phocaeicola vulgatus]